MPLNGGIMGQVIGSQKDWLQLVHNQFFWFLANQATGNCSPVVISCSPVQLPVFAPVANWTSKHYVLVQQCGCCQCHHQKRLVCWWPLSSWPLPSPHPHPHMLNDTTAMTTTLTSLFVITLVLQALVITLALALTLILVLMCPTTQQQWWCHCPHTTITTTTMPLPSCNNVNVDITLVLSALIITLTLTLILTCPTITAMTIMLFPLHNVIIISDYRFGLVQFLAFQTRQLDWNDVLEVPELNWTGSNPGLPFRTLDQQLIVTSFGKKTDIPVGIISWTCRLKCTIYSWLSRGSEIMWYDSGVQEMRPFPGWMSFFRHFYLYLFVKVQKNPKKYTKIREYGPV